MDRKYLDLIEVLQRFGKNSNIEFNEMETAAGKSLIYFVPGEPRFEGSWRLWITSRAKDIFHVILDNVDRGNQRVGISFPCNNLVEVYERLELALKLARLSNKIDSATDGFKSEDLKNVADSVNLTFTPRSILRFRSPHILVPSQRNPKSVWTVWVKHGDLFLTRKGFKRTPGEQIPDEETAGYLSFKASGSIKELIELAVKAATLAF